MATTQGSILSGEMLMSVTDQVTTDFTVEVGAL